MRWLTFFWFMGASATIVIVLTLFSYLSGPSLMLSAWNTVSGPLVRRVAREAVANQERGGGPDPDVLVLPLAQLPSEPDFQPVWRKLQRAPDGAVESAARLRDVATGVVIGTPNGRMACYLTLATRPLSWRGEGGMRWRVMAFFAVALGVSYLFARQITRPVEQMRAAARRFAGGDLRARVGPQQYQAPELRELATDFDEMASRIESLVLSQKRLLSDVSHELRSPLARLSLAVGLARRSANPETTTSLDRIETEADNLNRLIGRVLQLSRLEAGAAVRNEPVSLSGVLWEIVNNANFEAAHGKRVKLDAERSYEIDGDRELLASAIENVVRNGLHYTAPCSEVEVHLTGQGITVRDHGPGVKPEKLRAIFEPFYRLEAGRETRSGGVGLGLAIARRAILAHHGEIAARNHPEGGLEVEIRLPGLRA